MRTLSGKVAQWRPAYLPPDPASRTAYAAGEIAQCDFWFPPVQVPAGFGQVRTAAQLPVLTMVTGYARWASAVLIPSRRAEDLFAGWWQLISRLGAVPRVLVLGRRGRDRPVAGPAQRADRECQGFRGTLAARVIICRPRDPEAKGLVERLHDYLERSFLPGRPSRLRRTSTRSWPRSWSRANTRQHRALGCAPADRIEADRAAMIPLPPVAAGDRVAARVAAAPRPLRAAGRQRLLGPPVGHRPPHRGHRGPGPGAGVLRRPAGR